MDVIGSLSALTALKSKVQGSGGMASFIAGTPYAIGALLTLCGVGLFWHASKKSSQRFHTGLHMVFMNKLVQGVAEVGVATS